MSTDNGNDVSKPEGYSESESRSEGKSSGRGGSIISSSGESSTDIAGASAPRKSRFLDRLLSIFGRYR